jgi:trans-aconitate 2-methyltransferase
VEDLSVTLRQLLDSLAPGGLFLSAIAGWDNELLRFWETGFALLGKPVPYHTAEDMEAHLAERGARFRKTTAPYQLRFPDTAENRLKILRFLLGEYLPAIPLPRILAEWDRYVRGGHIEVNTHSYHYAVRPE